MNKKDLNFLLVDDNPTMFKMMVPMLKELGYQNFFQAQDGFEAWRTIKKGDQEIHIVISDFIMPNASGVELLNKIRSSDRFWDLPFIMVTGDDNQNSLMSSVEVDVNSYIIKPFTAEKLDEEITRVLNEKYNPSQFMRLLQKGRELLVIESDMEAAQKYFTEAKALNPLEPEPYFFAGIVYSRQEKYNEAKRELRKCIELREGHVKAYDLLALVYHREKQYAKEKETLETVTELSPDNPERNINLGRVCVNLGDDESAKKYLTKAARLARKNNIAAFERIFRIYLEGKNLANEAEGVYRKYIDKNMSDPRLLNRFALILKEHRAYDTAIYFLERIVNIRLNEKESDIPEEDMAVYYFNLAATYTERARAAASEGERQESFKIAEKYINKAIDCDPTHQDSRKLYAWLDEHPK